MEPSALGDDLNEVSVLLNVAHRLLLGIRDDVDVDPSIQSIVDDLNTAHDQLDAVMESIGTALDRVDEQTDRPPGQRPAIH
jgi:division protein CdvB (Snf7/Vps24/ESCRT-III family)